MFLKKLKILALTIGCAVGIQAEKSHSADYQRARQLINEAVGEAQWLRQNQYANPRMIHWKIRTAKLELAAERYSQAKMQYDQAADTILLKLDDRYLNNYEKANVVVDCAAVMIRALDEMRDYGNYPAPPGPGWGRGTLRDVLDMSRDVQSYVFQGQYHEAVRLLDRMDRILFRNDRDRDIVHARMAVRDTREKIMDVRLTAFEKNDVARNCMRVMEDAIRRSDAYRFENPSNPYPGPHPVPHPVPHPGPHPVPHPVPNPSVEILRVECSSLDFKRADCETGRRVLTARIIQKYSKAACGYGSSYFVEGTRLVVTNGCRGLFEVEVERRF